jgi:hypothetical protein
MPRPLAYRQLYPLSNRYIMVVLQTCGRVQFFICVMPSEERRFKLKLSLLCDDHIAAGTFVVMGSLQRTIRAVEGLKLSMIDVILIASRELVDDSRMGTAISPRSR